MTAGFDVETTDLDDQAKALDTAGEEVDAIKSGLTAPACYPSEVLGGADTASAFDAFAGAWLAECETLGGALHELADRLRTASNAYQHAEQAVITTLDQTVVGVLGGRFITPVKIPDAGSPFG